MDSLPLRVFPASDAALVVEATSAAGARRLVGLAEALRGVLTGGQRVDVVAGFDSLLIRYDPSEVSPAEVEAAIAGIDQTAKPLAARRLVIPAVYGGVEGPDLSEVAALHGMEAQEVVARHTAIDYRIRCIGFSPGFPYLEGLDTALQTARLSVPRVRVPAGSVAIGGEHTGVYPTASPGGWRLIGRTPLTLFDPQRDPPVPYGAGDIVRFTAINRDEFERLRGSAPLVEPV
jgi:KipI family sensor histidine kinase inhibitor